MAAFDAGELSFDQALVVAERAPSWADEQLCSLAKGCTVSQLRTAVNKYAFLDDPAPDDPAPDDSAPDAADRGPHEAVENDDAGASDPGSSSTGLARKFVSLVCDVDGTWRLCGRLGADHGLLLDAALRESADALFRASGRAPSQLEALIEIAERSLDAVESRSRLDRYRVHLLVDELGATDPLGRRLLPWVLDLVGCDSSLAVTWTRDGVPIEQGPAGDTIPAATRRHVLARDGGCVPGCGATHRLDVHHIAHRRDGGTHHPSNLIALSPCGGASTPLRRLVRYARTAATTPSARGVRPS